MDFSYNNTVVQITSGVKPLKTNVPVDVRIVVDSYDDIANIPSPYVGMTITVKCDETNFGKMTEYKVKSLKPNFIGIPNTAIDKIEKMVEYLEVGDNIVMTAPNGDRFKLVIDNEGNLIILYE